MKPKSKPILANHEVLVYEYPSGIGNFPKIDKTKYSVRFDDFEIPKAKSRKKKGEPDKKIDPSYLIIGFDTEFKSPDQAISRENIKQGEAKYEVLSYQFHCRTNDNVEWQGISIPESGTRMSLGEFIVFAVGKGIQENKIKKIPLKIYLAGHFTRADIPAFSDFKSLQYLISAVRNTFMSVDQHIPLKIKTSRKKGATLSIFLRDTMVLSPGSSKSLEALGELVGREKIRLDPDKQKEKHFKKNMDQLMIENWTLFREYALNDAVICSDYLARVIDQNFKATGSKSVPVTLTSIGVDLLMESWKQELKIDPLTILGQEEKVEKKYSKKLGYYKKETRTVPLQECFWHLDFVTETYHGGRNEQFWFGSSYESEWTDYDLSSAYPTAMALIGLPDWKNILLTTDVEKFLPTTLGYACVDFKFPEGTRYPTLPVRTDNGLVFPLEGTSSCAAPEIYLAKKLGCELRIRHGVIVPSKSDSLIFGDFIRSAIKKRGEYPKKSIDALFWKELSNSTYGKTAQGLREKRVYDIRDQETKPLPPSRITNPFFASFITSFVRATLGEIMNSLPADVLVFSCTTDGFLTDASPSQIEKASTGDLGEIFASSRQLLTGTKSVLEKKHEIKKPLGWRTRGQATLVPGILNPDDNTYHVVLARGGISVNYDEYPDAEDQSGYICDLFFNRTPDQMMTVKSLTGIRDIVEFDADLVEKELTRRLSMEFDWKRKPLKLTTDPQYDHISFSTQPWKSVEQFQMLREQWDEYMNAERKCIKTKDDYEQWAIYVDSRFKVDKKHRTYLKSKDPDLKRLRQSLCAAWKAKTAGFEKGAILIFVDKIVSIQTNQDFARFLTSCGIETSKADVENDKRKPFERGIVPYTPRAKEAFEKVKAVFKSLDADQIFAYLNRDSLLSIEQDAVCPFIDRLNGGG